MDFKIFDENMLKKTKQTLRKSGEIIKKGVFHRKQNYIKSKALKVNVKLLLQ